MHCIDETKLEPPIFRMECDSDVTLSKNPLRYTALDTNLRQSTESLALLNVPSTPPDLRLDKNHSIEGVGNERIRCPKGSLSLIETIRRDAGATAGLVNGLGALLRYDDQIEPASPVLLPLRTEDFPPLTPTSAPSEHMLPSPASSDPKHSSLYCRQPTPRESRQEDLGYGLSEKVSESTGSFSGNGHTIVASTAKDDLLRNRTTAPDSASKAFTEDRHSVDETRRISGQRSGAGLRKIASIEAFLPLCTKRAEVLLPETVLRNISMTKSKQRAPQELPSTALSPEQLQIASGKYSHLPNQPLRVNLGSLSSFMETRGKGTKQQATAKSPYFTTEKDNKSLEQSYPDAEPDAPVLVQRLDRPRAKPPQPALSRFPQVPHVPTQHEGLVLMVSTKLLKTHLQLIRCLEGSAHPPKLVYRDHPTNSLTNQSKSQLIISTFHQQQQQRNPPSIPPPSEADIILSPKTAIILTTSQATMQIYLPGHKSTINQTSAIPKPDIINSPLREQIYDLSPRYEQLYILIAHGPDSLSKKRHARASPLPITADKRLLMSMTALTAFCNTLSSVGNITPLLIPSYPDSLATWILALAHKHVCQLPLPRFQSRFRSAFTPVNPKPRIGSELGDMEESVWEMFLRRLGLNPFAAQVVLVVLRREEGDIDDGEYDECDQGGGAGHLSRFVEMSSKKRRVLFMGLLGEKILKRVDSVIERDWQCDWALNFDDAV
ncbi:hypothetical protein BJX70DRAFT_396217 [Aspergillus crustosus]